MRRWLFWIPFLAVALGASVAMIFTVFFRATYHFPTNAGSGAPARLALEVGDFLLVQNGGNPNFPSSVDTPSPHAGLHVHAQNPDYTIRTMWHWPVWADDVIRVPMWCVFVAAFVPLTSAALVRRARRRSIAAPCPNCGYSLAGMAIGAQCPECGAVIS
ncbi:hypothetical protein BH11PLA1_BH11PLA1_04110 [soil metagenome]